MKIESPLTAEQVEKFGSRINQLRSGWNQSFQSLSGGRDRRRARRANERLVAKRVKVANRRRFRTWESQKHATSTLISQVRIYSGEIGNELQRTRVTKMFTEQARALGQPVDEIVDALRVGLGLNG